MSTEYHKAPPKQFLAVVPGGLDQNRELKHLLGKLKRTLADRGTVVRWNPPALWHITLKFLGEVSNQPALPRALAAWRPVIGDLTFSLGGLGVFPTVEAARVLWVGVRASQGFLDLQADLDRHLREFGIEAETQPDRPFRPHLTLARFRNPLGAADLVNLGGRRHFGDYRPTEVVLFESMIEGSMVKYAPRARFSLTADSRDEDRGQPDLV